jgi:1,4-dihydroxy-2-naphthoate octaprenyltransferase
MSGATLTEWIQAARPKTLSAAVTPVLMAHFLVDSYSSTHVSILLSLLALSSAVLIQIGTNFFNDVIDFQSGADSSERKGPHRLLLQGKVSETKLRAAAQACFLLALILGIPLVLKGGLIILAIGITSIIIGYSYSAPPLKLAYRGIAEPFVVIFFGIIATIGIELVHTKTFTVLGLLSGLQLGLLATVLMVINNIRDYEQDRKSGKKTSVARFGKVFGIFEVILIFIAILNINFLISLRTLPYPTLNLLWIIPAIVVAIDLFSYKNPQELNATLAKAALAHLGLGIGRTIQIILTGS